MKKYILFLTVLMISGRLASQSKTPRWQLGDFAIDLNKLTTPSPMLWVGSGYCTVNPVLGSVLGTADLLSPPIAGRNLSLRAVFVVNGDTIQDRFVWGGKPRNILYTGGTWQPDRIIRRGIYHRLHSGGPISFEVTSHLIPLADRPGFLLRYEVKNLGEKPLQLKVLSLLDPGKPALYALDKWGFTVPPWGYSPAPFGISPPTDSINVKRDGVDSWSTDKVKLRLYTALNGGSNLEPGATTTGYMSVVFALKGQVLDDVADFAGWEKKTSQIWDQRLGWALANIPKLQSSNRELVDYYNRSIVSGLVCIWEKPDFKLNPSLVTSGLDGGSMSTYLWDVAGYAPHLVTSMMGDKILPIARNMVAIDLEKYNAYTPDGAGAGVRYAYSTVAFTSLVYAIACQHTVYPDLFEQVKRLVLADEQRPKIDGLVDYGEQKNLLEMRGMGWEHVVPSPNAERVWNLRNMARMGEKIGIDAEQISQWRRMADTIALAIGQLWDDKVGWFFCRYPDGHKEWVYSIQVFDILRAGVCTPAMTQRMLQQLKENKFLFPYGVSSISKADSLHYEATDTDWGGGGAYSGDVAQLALDLYHQHFPEKAWDMLQRQFWLGQQWPYFPQEHFCDRPASPIFKRANIIAGLTGAEAILFGLVGFDPQLDGSLWINPQPTTNETISINGFGFRGHVIDVTISKTFCRITRNGKIVYKGKPLRFKII
jgi:hypothetical protein